MLTKINEFIKRFMKSKEAEKKYEGYHFQERIWKEQGVYLGRKEGWKEGRMEGQTSEKKKVIENMINQGFDLEAISLTVEIPVSKIKEIMTK